MLGSLVFFWAPRVLEGSPQRLGKRRAQLQRSFPHGSKQCRINLKSLLIEGGLVTLDPWLFWLTGMVERGKTWDGEKRPRNHRLVRPNNDRKSGSCWRACMERGIRDWGERYDICTRSAEKHRTVASATTTTSSPLLVIHDCMSIRDVLMSTTCLSTILFLPASTWCTGLRDSSCDRNRDPDNSERAIGYNV